MTKSNFFLEALKTVSVLVIICLVCGALLAVCNQLLYVSDAEKLDRAMQKIYPDFVSDGDHKVDPAFQSNSMYGNIKAVYPSKDGAYVIEAVGIGGYKGTVTLYVVVGGDAIIKAWTIKESQGETLLSNFSDKQYKSWYVGKEISTDFDYKTENFYIAGTTMTSNAIANAVKMASYYCMNALGLGENPELEAKTATLALLGDAYSAYELSAPIALTAMVDASNSLASVWSTADNSIAYYFTGTGDNGDIQAFVYGEKDNYTIVVTSGNGEVVAKTDNASDDLVAKVTAGKLVQVAVNNKAMFAYISANEQGVYTVAGIKTTELPKTYVLTVTVSEANGAGVVDSISIVISGYIPGGPSQDNTDKLATSLVGATSATIDGIYTGEFASGATQSGNLITTAVKAVLADFDSNLANNG